MGFCYACVAEFEFGAEYRADFLLLRPDSPGWHAALVELEAPASRLYTSRGTPAKNLLAAKKQIQDWREWVRQNEPYFRQRLAAVISSASEVKKKAMQLHFRPSARHDIADMRNTLLVDYVIMIGRSSQLSDEELRRRSMDLQHSDIADIVTYDRLLRHAGFLDQVSRKKCKSRTNRSR